ncbi:hypothetical protein CYMTET_54107 [Cymbomonas tetramitiformis]|uniref:Uncharacterized protein n=1 Tax=Cymbomonas tetramitiformis TaxID=36881 RepID=A0AAE0BFN0_9CHLO|nr:hypothetical protein CYMTET_54107 [Cymbomonas tetramitiformis]
MATTPQRGEKGEWEALYRAAAPSSLVWPAKNLEKGAMTGVVSLICEGRAAGLALVVLEDIMHGAQAFRLHSRALEDYPQ